MMPYKYSLKKLKNKRGGTPKNSGAKPQYSEQTKTVAFRCPLSKVDELKLIVKSTLSGWSVKNFFKIFFILRLLFSKITLHL
jgi:hypothetical protein